MNKFYKIETRFAMPKTGFPGFSDFGETGFYTLLLYLGI